MSKDRIYVIDTFSLMFQVFHAIPPMTGTQGQPTNAVFGITRDLLSILEKKPSHLVCAFDSPGPGQREQIFEAYKANRAEMPEDLRPQIPLIKEVLAGFRIAAVECATWEADDVIATLARMGTEAGLDVVIVSSDKDIRQLLGPNVRLYNCRKNVFLDEAGLMEDWGVRPDQVIDFQSLVGDSVDNVPGVPKIGPKTARTLIEKFGTLDNILANAADAPGKIVKANLVEFADQARMSRELVTLRNDLELGFDLEDARVAEPDRPALFELFTRLGFKRYAAMMRDNDADGEIAPVFGSENAGKTSSRRSGKTAKREISLDEIQAIESPAELSNVLSQFEATSTVFLDASITDGLLRDLKFKSIGFSDGQGHFWFSEFVERKSDLTAGSGDESLFGAFLTWLSSFAGEIALPNGKAFLHASLNADIHPKAKLFDTSIADYLLDAGAREHELSDVADRHSSRNLLVVGRSRPQRQKTMFDEESEKPDARSDSTSIEKSLLRLHMLVTVTQSLKAALAGDSMHDLYESLERPLITVLAELEHKGIYVDVEELNRQSNKAADRIEQLTAEIFAAAGTQFNVDSPKQLGDVLFKQLKLPVLKKTKTGFCTDQDVLERLALVHPLPAKIIERRQLAKLRGTYLDALPQLVHPETGRIHATFHQTVASTGRLSASDPNLQNIPIRTEEGRLVRRAFRAGIEEWKLVCADYSQIELRVLAHFSRDKALTDAFRRGVDIHAAVASDVFQIPVEEVKSDQRRVAKAVNFGVIYGQTPFGLANALGISRGEAADFIRQYFDRYAGVAEFCERVLRETLQSGFARTILNRRREITGIRSVTGIQRNMPERTAINTVIQGSAADLIKKAMIDVARVLDESELPAALLLQIHDELVFEVSAEHCDQLIHLITPAMQNAIPLDVPLVVDITSGKNWLDQEEV